MVVGRIPRGTFSGDMNTRTQRIDALLLAQRPWLLLALAFLFCGATLGWLAESEPAKSNAEPRAALEDRLAAYLAQPRFSSAAWGVKVVSLETGKTLFEHQSHKLLNRRRMQKLLHRRPGVGSIGVLTFASRLRCMPRQDPTPTESSRRT